MRRIELTGLALKPCEVVDLALGYAWAEIGPGALNRAAVSAAAAERIVRRRPVYGRTTGVGANRTQEVPADDEDHGLRLLRSHAGGVGDPVPQPSARAMLAVRANQLLSGGAGVRPEIIETIVSALNMGAVPEVLEFGSLGTSDLSALAQLGLALAGEAPWEGVGPYAIPVASDDALALMSSSALTVGQACVAWHEATRFLDAAHAIAALTFMAVDGNREAYAETVHERRPYPAYVRSAGFMRHLLEGLDSKDTRIQDPFALRCVPQIHGTALSALDQLETVLGVEVNAAVENPLISADNSGEGEAVFHHGGFHQAQLSLALDSLNLALLSVGQLSTARLNMLYQPEFTSLRPFLADGEVASSGVMILEYAATAALADMRNAAMPASLGHAVLSRGVEDHTPFTSQSVRQTTRACAGLRLVLAAELVAAVRALRLRGITLAEGTVLRDLIDLVAELDPNTTDRSTTTDHSVAAELLPTLAAQAARILPGRYAH